MFVKSAVNVKLSKMQLLRLRVTVHAVASSLFAKVDFTHVPT